jgi:hypothetical protein
VVLIAITCVALAAMSAAASIASPLVAMMGLGGLLSVALLTFGERLRPLFLAALAGLLIGYAFFGRGLAHVGVGPLYVSEMVLGLGGLMLLTSLHRIKLGAIECLLLAFMALGVARTLPFVTTYSLDAARDAVLWGYAVLVFAVLAAMPSEDKAQSAVRLYRRILPFLLLWIPVAGVISDVAPGLVPAGPGSEVSLLGFKGGDMSVHLAGAAAFIALGLHSQSPHTGFPIGLLWTLWLAGYAVAGLNRGGLLTAGIGLATAFALHPTKRALQFGAIAGLVILLAALLQVEIDTGKSNNRKISVDQFVASLKSVVGEDESSNLQGSRDYRLEWWGDIVSYTFTGPYFFTGKGFGVNLADDDGFQVLADGSLRAPHNSHMTVLARMGVPGLALWIALQGTFGVSLALAWRRAARAGLSHWAAVDGWLLIYWLAAMTNASFDPYLEGPQGGFWFWTVIGLGLYAMRTQRPEVLRAEEAQRPQPRRRFRRQLAAPA